MDNICKICNESFSELSSLHKHLRKHKITQGEYYHKFYPRYDRYDNSIIKYKDYESYFNSDFNSKFNRIEWMKSVPPETLKNYIVEFFKKRKIEKSLVFAPSQVELKSMNLPEQKSLTTLFGDYYNFCKEINLAPKFNPYLLSFDTINISNGNYKIYVDTREKLPLNFDIIESESKKLDFGDYCFSDNKWTGNIYIERKSLADFFGTLSSGLDRFTKELERCAENNAYLIILVESNLDICLNYRKYKINSEFIFHNVREIIKKFPNVQFLFVNSHAAGASMVEKIFTIGKAAKNIDLQFYNDLNLLSFKEINTHE